MIFFLFFVYVLDKRRKKIRFGFAPANVLW